MSKKFTGKFIEGRTCIFCNKYHLYRLKNNRVKCGHCKRYYSLNKLRKDIKVLYYFYLEVSAQKASKELCLSYNTVRKRYMFFREKITDYSENHSEKLKGELELDESYFGGKRKGNRGRGAFNKAIVFGILERNGKVYTKVVPDVTKETLMDVIRTKTQKGSVFYTDCFKSYKSLKQFGKHMKINHQHTFGKSHNHINGLEGFWSYAKERFHKYHGINMKNYSSYLKEMELRYNHRNEDLYKLMFDIIFDKIGADFH